MKNDKKPKLRYRKEGKFTIAYDEETSNVFITDESNGHEMKFVGKCKVLSRFPCID